MTRDPNDASTFPRYIEENNAAPDDVSELINQFEDELHKLNQMTTMFEGPGWAFVSEELQREAESLDRKARGETESSQWFLWRGQAMTLWYLLDLPDRVNKVRRRVMEDYRRLVGEEE